MLQGLAGGGPRRTRPKSCPERPVVLAAVYPTAKCRLRLLKLERIKDFLLMEEEFIRNQDVLKPKEEHEKVGRR